MNKIELESYLDEYVEVTLFDNFSYSGILSRTDDYLEKYGKTGYYFVSGVNDNQIFKCSHVKKILNQHGVEFEAGQKIAQVVFSEKTEVILEQTDNIISDTDRGTGGFGSTGAF